MTLTVTDCLSIVQDDWITFEDREGCEACVPADVFDVHMVGSARMRPIEQETGWAWRWFDSGRDCLTDNQWTGVFKTHQEAFDDWFDYHKNSCDDTCEQCKEALHYAALHDLKDKEVRAWLKS